jgi:antitoxin component YwqK of YwqJK toxin-antitoxin module
MRFFLLFTVVLFSLQGFGQTTDPSGRKQGYWKKYDEYTKKLLYEGEFKDDRPVGMFKYYYPTDSVRALMSFRKDGRSSYAVLFHPNGKKMAEGKYLTKEIKDSVWSYYDEEGKILSRDTYKSGKKEGPSFVYLRDGRKAEERQYRNDLLDGPFVQYSDGVKVKGKGQYEKGKMEGKFSFYYPNGVEAASGYYKNGVKNGPWIYLLENGKVKERELYNNGELASPKESEEFFKRQQDKKAGSASSTTLAPKGQTRPGDKK